MIALIELLFGAIELLLSWRLLVGLALTLVVVLIAVSAVQNEAAQYIIGVPLGLVGVFLSFRWQIRADTNDS